RRGRIRDREVIAVAGAHAHRAVAAALRRGVRHLGARLVRLAFVAAEQLVEEAALLARGGAVLRAAIVLRQRDRHRAALLAAVEIAAAQPLQVNIDAVEIAAHARDLAVEVDALLRGGLPAAEQEEAGALAALAPALLDHAVELALLARRGVLVAADLLAARLVAAAAIDRAELSLEPRTDRILSRHGLRHAGAGRIRRLLRRRRHGQNRDGHDRDGGKRAAN